MGDISGIEDEEEMAKKRRRKVVLMYEDVQYEVDLITWEEAIKKMQISEIIRLYGRVRLEAKQEEELQVEEEKISYWIEDSTEAESNVTQEGKLPFTVSFGVMTRHCTILHSACAYKNMSLLRMIFVSFAWYSIRGKEAKDGNLRLVRL